MWGILLQWITDNCITHCLAFLHQEEDYGYLAQAKPFILALIFRHSINGWFEVFCKMHFWCLFSFCHCCHLPRIRHWVGTTTYTPTYPATHTYMSHTHTLTLSSHMLLNKWTGKVTHHKVVHSWRVTLLPLITCWSGILHSDWSADGHSTASLCKGHTPQMATDRPAAGTDTSCVGDTAIHFKV